MSVLFGRTSRTGSCAPSDDPIGGATGTEGPGAESGPCRGPTSARRRSEAAPSGHARSRLLSREGGPAAPTSTFPPDERGPLSSLVSEPLEVGSVPPSRSLRSDRRRRTCSEVRVTSMRVVPQGQWEHGDLNPDMRVSPRAPVTRHRGAKRPSADPIPREPFDCPDWSPLVCQISLCSHRKTRGSAERYPLSCTPPPSFCYRVPGRGTHRAGGNLM